MAHLPLWSDRNTIPKSNLTRAKITLGLIIAVTSILPLFFVELDDATFLVNLYKVLAKIGAFIGSMFMIWQFFLGFRGVVSSIFPDLSWVVDLHKALGMYGVPIILLHPVFIGLYYLELRGTNIYDLQLDSGFSQFVLLGIVLLGLIAFITISSAFFRQKMGFYRWLYTHLSAYLVPPFLFLHSFALGQTVGGTGLNYYWWFLAAVMVVLYIYRVAHKLGAFSARYRVSQAREVAKETTEVVLEPGDGALEPRSGQFVYMRESVKKNAHPYTVSSFDEHSRVLSITATQEGSQTTRLQNVAPGAMFLLDGPYGVFTRGALASDLPLVMIAGGIGITPFRRVWRELERTRDREAHLFFANEHFEEITFRDEVDALEHVHVVHVLNQEPEFEGEKGFVTVDILRRHLPRELRDYQILICGPPVMITKLEAALKETDIPENQIRHEMFAT
ncbi:MAG: ferric reductase-like transmembrane domain-containing protein [Spirochaetales bacterium]